MKRFGWWLVGAVAFLGAPPVVAQETVDAASGILKPRLLESADPPSPSGAHGDASVVLSVLINEDGRVTEVQVRSGEAPFDAVAQVAVAAWRFAPAMRDNVPVRARVMVKVEGAHSCCTMRGVKKEGVGMSTTARRGSYREQPQMTEQVYRQIGR